MENDIEIQVVEFFTLKGHHVERVIKHENSVFDLIITSNKGEKWIARCQTDDIDEATIRDFYKTLQIEKPKQATVITKGVVTPHAKELMKGKPVYLLDNRQFQNLLQGVKNSKVKDKNAEFNFHNSSRSNNLQGNL